MIAPELFTPGDPALPRPLSVARQLEAARTRCRMRESSAAWASPSPSRTGNISDRRQALRAAQGAQAGAGARASVTRNQEADGQSAPPRWEFPAPARRTDAQQSEQLARPVIQYQNAEPSRISRACSTVVEANVALRRPRCRQSNCSTVAADAGKPEMGRRRPVLVRRMEQALNESAT